MMAEPGTANRMDAIDPTFTPDGVVGLATGERTGISNGRIITLVSISGISTATTGRIMCVTMSTDHLDTERHRPVVIIKDQEDILAIEATKDPQGIQEDVKEFDRVRRNGVL